MGDPTTPTAALLVDAQGAADLCGVSRRLWFQWQASGLIPPAVLRRERVVRWRRADIERWIADGCPPAERWRARR